MDDDETFFFFFFSPACAGKVNKCNTVSSLCNCGLVALEGGGKKTPYAPVANGGKQVGSQLLVCGAQRPHACSSDPRWLNKAKSPVDSGLLLTDTNQ